MSFDLALVTPHPRDWFSTSVSYEGFGSAEFVDPRGTIEGPVAIKIDETGQSRVHMIAERVTTAQPLRFGLHQLLSGKKLADDERTFTFGGDDGFDNPCASLTVTTPEGVYTGVDGVHVIGFHVKSSGNSDLDFVIGRAIFAAPSANMPRYWVLPLCNFISKFPPYAHELGQHPLRIYLTPSVPGGLSERDTLNARLLAESKNRLITFEFADESAYIEPLADHEERTSALLDGRSRTALTALMIGSVGGASDTYADLDHWFPHDFLPLLGLATGREVGAPWIELRDGQGELVRRFHVNLARPVFATGRAAMDGFINPGLGLLLTQAQTSPEFGKDRLRVALKHLVRGQLESLTIEDRLSHLFRSLDGLCKSFGITGRLGPQETLKGLDAQSRGDFNRIFRAATKGIDTLARHAKREGWEEERAVLSTISQQLGKAKHISQGYGKSVVKLIEHFEFPDAEIMATYFADAPRIGAKTWPDALSKYRGVVMHDAYIDFRSGSYDVMHVVMLMNHLHDLLLRIILKLLGYTGTYQPTLQTRTAAEPIDWVKPDFTARKLGCK